MTRCPVPVSCFCCFLFQKIHLWKYSRNCAKIYRDFLFATMKMESRGQPRGRPTGQGQPAAATTGPPVGGTHPCPWWVPSAPSDAYKITLSLISLGRLLFWRNSIPKPSPPRNLIRRDSEAVPGTLPEGRSIPEGSSSTCLPPR